MNGSEHRVLVVGGGIAGLTAALALRHHGIDVTVFERSSEVGEVGASLQVWTNGLVALRAIGIGDAIDAASGKIETQQFRTSTGRILIDIPLGEMARQHDLPVPVLTTRPELVKSLYDALDAEIVRTNRRCAAFRQDADGVSVFFEDGREERGSVLIGADGIDSTIRRQLYPSVTPRYAGYQFLRALITFSDPSLPPGTQWFFYGPGDRYVLGDLGHGRTFAVAIISTPAGSQDGPSGRKAELIERYAGFAPVVRAAIEATPESALGRTDIRDLRPLKQWGKGLVTLIGDAAHATTPNMGRGATEAIVDGVVLASYMAKDSDPVAALRAYELQRMAPTASITTMSRRMGAMALWESSLACTARDVIMQTVMAMGMRRSMDSELAELARNSTLMSIPAGV